MSVKSSHEEFVCYGCVRKYLAPKTDPEKNKKKAQPGVATVYLAGVIPRAGAWTFGGADISGRLSSLLEELPVGLIVFMGIFV